ncbi:hypothetical protein AN478_09610 [Thiohalorhabdus denitrificans]|uniref:Nitroreductase family protein n=1 Tax=Thiohalorhabdus denitrificans TaxID=381306 RepID=A0A0P9ELG5_9GAMM|nr:hypothetical protein [Thiohalorhabdus denitrificans]KPV39423.1 hypothetical protein AN478_09610 [Thiohalorhabdus denitrificans]SCY03641.1 hypothetical protein SAMN05661077_1117 [Thiohalorhabdus denitrificans]
MAEPGDLPPDPRQLLHDADPKRRLDYLVGRAAMAPSPYNTQPWRFRSKDPAVVDLQRDEQRRLQEADPDGRLLFLALGAALENFLIAAADLGFAPELEEFPEGEEGATVARIHLPEPGPLPEPDPRVGLQAVRRTAHGPLHGPADEAMRQAAEGLDLEGVHLDWVAEAEREPLIAIAVEAVTRRWRRRAFRRELWRWLRKDAAALEQERDGMALTNRRRLPGWVAAGARQAMLRVPGLMGPGRKAARRLRKAPALLALSTEGDGAGYWLATGRAYQRLGLELAHAGVALGPEAALTADPEARRRTAELLGRDHPQLVARVGRARPRPGLPRRRLHRVLNPPSPNFPLYPRSD